MIRETTTAYDGTVYEWWRHDPGYHPPLPRGAVRGDVTKQVYCAGHHVPKYFYVDEDRDCIQCGQSFVFRAEEQKYWYETLRFNFSSVPIRCATCRRRQRSEHSLREQIARSKAQLRATSADPGAHLSLARAIVEYHERTGHGNLNEAVAASRKAAELWPESRDPLFWEGAAHALAGRNAKARRCLQQFLSQSGHVTASLQKRAQEYLQRL
jgi:hypothetical protein